MAKKIFRNSVVMSGNVPPLIGFRKNTIRGNAMVIGRMSGRRVDLIFSFENGSSSIIFKSCSLGK